MEGKRQEGDGPWVLPIVSHGVIQYYTDLRLRQFISPKNPRGYVAFDSEQGKQMCERVGVVVCRECQMAVIISPVLDKKELRCMNCLALIVPRVRL